MFGAGGKLIVCSLRHWLLLLLLVRHWSLKKVNVNMNAVTEPHIRNEVSRYDHNFPSLPDQFPTSRPVALQNESPPFAGEEQRAASDVTHERR
jgi:hypothetical protein